LIKGAEDGTNDRAQLESTRLGFDRAGPLAVGPIALAAAQSRQAGLTAATHQEVAAARAATAKYHDIAQAEADGYIDFGLYEPGEGFHWVNLSLIDTQFDPAHPR